MLIQRVYIGKDESLIKYYIRKDIESVQFYDANLISVSEFLSLHHKKLISNESVSCIFNIDKLDKDLVLSLIPKVQEKVIWCFYSLPKSRKVYKSLKEVTQIKSVSDLTSTREKKKFIESLRKEYGIPTKFKEDLLLYLPDDALSIESEVNKFAVALEALTEEEAVKTLTNFQSNYDLMNFCNYLFTDTEKACFYIDRIAKKEEQYKIGSVLLKRLKYLTYLALNDVNTAKTYWRGSDYFISQDKAVAKSVGFDNLLKAESVVLNMMIDYYDIRTLKQKLNFLVFACNTLINEDDYSWD